MIVVVGAVIAALLVCAALVSPAIVARLERRRAGSVVERTAPYRSEGAPYAAMADRLQLSDLGAPSAPS